jgi:hypothetical protein
MSLQAGNLEFDDMKMMILSETGQLQQHSHDSDVDSDAVSKGDREVQLVLLNSEQTQRGSAAQVRRRKYTRCRN